MTGDQGAGGVAELVVVRGLPGCGKSTAARAWVALDPANRARINRDDSRAMMHGGPIGPAGERQVSIAHVAAIGALLAAGISVINDDTNLLDEYVQQRLAVAADVGATARVWDMRGVPLDVCLSQNAQRTGDARLPDAAIKAMHAEHVAPALATGKVSAVPLADIGSRDALAVM